MHSYRWFDEDPLKIILLSTRPRRGPTQWGGDEPRCRLRPPCHPHKHTHKQSPDGDSPCRHERARWWNLCRREANTSGEERSSSSSISGESLNDATVHLSLKAILPPQKIKHKNILFFFFRTTPPITPTHTHTHTHTNTEKQGTLRGRNSSDRVVLGSKAFDVFWLDSGGGDGGCEGLSKAKRNQCSFNKDDLGGREKQTVVLHVRACLPYRSLPPIQETGKYFNSKQLCLRSLRGPQAAPLVVSSASLLPASVCMFQCTRPPAIIPQSLVSAGSLMLTMPHVIGDTCILQLPPSKSNIIQISQDTSRRSAAWRIPVINPRLHADVSTK